MPMTCPLCQTDGGRLLFSDDQLRVIAVDDPDYPGYTRVVWRDHVAEMTDLDTAERAAIMETVYVVERVLRDTMSPDKINLAAFGTMVPHLHWHIIPRWRDDPRYPDAYWAPPRVSASSAPPVGHGIREARQAQADQYDAALCAALSEHRLTRP